MIGNKGGLLLLKYNPELKTKAQALRTALTDAERRLWNRLRRKQILGVQFYRQKPVGNYIVDVYAPATRLVVEVDGAQHAETAHTKHDHRRTEYLQQHGLRVLRFDDRQVLLETDAVVQEIYRAVNETRS
jgi:very-short-patch-repair endonuclease